MGGASGPAHPRRLARAALAAAALGLACAAPPPPSAEPGAGPAAEPREPVPEPRAPPPCQHVERIDVHKRERRLVARCAGGAERAFPVALGREPVGAKREAGDGRTPEGRYHVRGPAVPSRFHRFLPIDYPSLAEAARAEGRLSEAALERIRAAHARGSVPPADTPLGGAIGLHGEGERWKGATPHIDWTDGCKRGAAPRAARRSRAKVGPPTGIALSDEAVDFLSERVAPGTPIAIHPDRASDPRAAGKAAGAPRPQEVRP